MKRRSLSGIFAASLLSSLFCIAASKKQPACVASLESCPRSGCYKANTPEGWENVLKHHRTSADDFATVTIKDFANLQKQADARFSDANDLGCPSTYANPSKNVRLHCLTKLKIQGGSVSEQDPVELIGFLAKSESKSGPPKANVGGESVNCRLTGTTNNDFHINIVASPSDSEFKGVVVEMIPQDRSDEWVLSKLRAIQKAKLQVRVRGQLMLDNKHRVNADESDPIGGQPKRMSLWEIHPVMEFDVCTQKKCSDLAGWVPLESWKAGRG
jgi:hypothetical protein